jgi:hypothetical protein
MLDFAGWTALSATCIAAVMTASNLGKRVNGWACAIFTVGAVAWIIVGVITHQRHLIYSNIFLFVVDVFGIWRWLGTSKPQHPVLGTVISPQAIRATQSASVNAFSRRRRPCDGPFRVELSDAPTPPFDGGAKKL